MGELFPVCHVVSRRVDLSRLEVESGERGDDAAAPVDADDVGRRRRTVERFQTVAQRRVAPVVDVTGVDGEHHVTDRKQFDPT